MSQIIVDPNELRRFNRLLLTEAGSMEGQKKSLSQKFSSLGEFWRDAKYERFGRELEASMKQIELFQKEASRFSAFLERKARAADNYLNR